MDLAGSKVKRTRICTVDKKKPTPSQVKERLTAIQNVIQDKNLTKEQVCNSDETGVNWAISLKHQYVPDDAARAVGLEGNEKGRFTSLLTGNGAGQMLPQMDIVKVACQNPNDLTTSRVLDGYMKEEGPCPV